MKKAFKFLVLMMGILVLGACGNSADTKANGEADTKANGESKKIGYVINNLNDTFQTYILNAALEAAENEGYTVEVVNSEEDLIKQQDGVNTLIQNGADGIVVVPVDTSAMGPITDAAQNAGVPLVYVNRNPYAGKEDQMPDGIYYVGSDEIQAGIMQGEQAGKLVEEGGVAILMGILGNEGAVARTNGIKQVLEEKYPNLKILAEESALWQRDQAITVTENWLSAYGDELKVVLANNDEMALGAIQALQANGRQDVVVMGVDAIPDALAAIKEGKMSASVFQDAKGQGAGAVDTLFAAFKGEKVDEKVKFVDFKLVTKENVADFE